MIPWNLS